MRWTGLLACAAARSFAASLLGLHGGRGADGFAPRSHEVECDHRFAVSVRLLWRGHCEFGVSVFCKNKKKVQVGT